MKLSPQNRTRVISAGLGLLFTALVGKGGFIALSGAGDVPERRIAVQAGEPIRGDIIDRNGELLATSVSVYSLYADPSAIWDAGDVVRELATVLPDIDVAAMTTRLSNRERSFEWVKRGLTPRQRQVVFELGLEGLGFREESRRAYPRGTLAGHVLGYAGLDGNGLAGIEFAMDDQLKAGREPVRLTIDNGLQAAIEAELSAAAAVHSIKGGTAILLDARSGEVRAMASWPPVSPYQARQLPGDDAARLNRATNAVYELGSVFKPLTVAAAIEAGVVMPDDIIDVRHGLTIGGKEIEDDHPIRGDADLTQIIAHSSNVGTVKINMMLGPRRQKAFLESLGLFERSPVELSGSAAPLVPQRWDDLTAATVSYGHGIAVTPMAFVSAFSALANGGERVAPTLIMTDQRRPKPERVMSALTAGVINTMMRYAVVDGTGRQAEVAGYGVAGKTGTAEKPVAGGYDEDRNITSFASIFPYDRPQYALIVTLDEPHMAEEAGAVGGATAAWNAAPTAGRMIERVAPLLGLAPRFDEARPVNAPIRSVSYERSVL